MCASNESSFVVWARVNANRAGQTRSFGRLLARACGGGTSVLWQPAVIDFDHNATTPLDPRVRSAMIELLADPSLDGNPSSVHGRGRAARAVVEQARRSVARALGAEALGVTFTSGGTEADALALLGSCRALRRAGQPCGLLSTAIEHPAVDGLVRLGSIEKDERERYALDESGVWSKPVVTQVLPLVQFYPAETYHQDYYQRNSQQGYCQVVISPKLSDEEASRQFPQGYKTLKPYLRIVDLEAQAR